MIWQNIRVKYSLCILIFQSKVLWKFHMYTRNNVTYYEIHIMSYPLLKFCFIMISIIVWFTKNFIIKLTLGLFLRYSYILGDFHPDILTEAVLIKERVFLLAVGMGCVNKFEANFGCYYYLILCHPQYVQFFLCCCPACRMHVWNIVSASVSSNFVSNSSTVMAVGKIK